MEVTLTANANTNANAIKDEEPLIEPLQNEQILAERARSDPDAFGALYDHFFPRLYNYVIYRVRDPHSADDLTAQIFERVLVYLDTYKPERGAFGAWLFTIARGVVSNHHRAQKHRRWLSLDRLREQPSDLPQPESAAEQHDQYAELLGAVAALNERERDLIALRFGAGLNNREIAAMTALSESNVGVILHRALRKLREKLSDEG